MARGWESKDVDAQIDAAEAERLAHGRPAVTEEQKARDQRRVGLVLARSRIVAAIDTARDDRHRAQLVAALEHLDAEIRAIDGHKDEGASPSP